MKLNLISLFPSLHLVHYSYSQDLCVLWLTAPLLTSALLLTVILPLIFVSEMLLDSQELFPFL